MKMIIMEIVTLVVTTVILLAMSALAIYTAFLMNKYIMLLVGGLCFYAMTLVWKTFVPSIGMLVYQYNVKRGVK